MGAGSTILGEERNDCDGVSGGEWGVGDCGT